MSGRPAELEQETGKTGHRAGRVPGTELGLTLTKPKTRSVVGLDIESGFIAAAELSGGNAPLLRRAATESLMPGLFHEGEVMDPDGLAEQLKIFFAEHKLPKRVRLGLASQRVALRVLELPAIDGADELEAAVRFQAQEELPMPLEQAVLDHRVLERFSDGESERMRVLVVGARRDSVERLLAATRRAGLTPELVDLSAFAMIRALYVPPEAHESFEHLEQPQAVEEPVPVEVPEGFGPLEDSEGTGLESTKEMNLVEGFEALGGGDVAEANGFGEEHPMEPLMDPAVMSEETDQAIIYCYVGGGTNLAIGVGTNCVFNRVLPNGAESMAATLAERRGLTLAHSREWLRHVGLDRDLDTIEGEREIVEEARTVLERGAARIADDVRLSLEYYHAATANARRVERMIMSGPGIALEGFPHAVEAQLGVPVVPRSLGNIEVNPGALDGVDASQLTVAAGLALDEVKR